MFAQGFAGARIVTWSTKLSKLCKLCRCMFFVFPCECSCQEKAFTLADAQEACPRIPSEWSPADADTSHQLELITINAETKCAWRDVKDIASDTSHQQEACYTSTVKGGASECAGGITTPATVAKGFYDSQDAPAFLSRYLLSMRRRAPLERPADIPACPGDIEDLNVPSDSDSLASDDMITSLERLPIHTGDTAIQDVPSSRVHSLDLDKAKKAEDASLEFTGCSSMASTVSDSKVSSTNASPRRHHRRKAFSCPLPHRCGTESGLVSLVSLDEINLALCSCWCRLSKLEDLGNEPATKECIGLSYELQELAATALEHAVSRSVPGAMEAFEEAGAAIEQVGVLMSKHALAQSEVKSVRDYSGIDVHPAFAY